MLTKEQRILEAIIYRQLLFPVVFASSHADRIMHCECFVSRQENRLIEKRLNLFRECVVKIYRYIYMYIYRLYIYTPSIYRGLRLIQTLASLLY